MSPEPCTRKTIFGRPACRYEARYDMSAAQGTFKLRADRIAGMQRMSDALRDKTYVRDVCVKCGRTIERMEVQDAFMEGHDEGMMK